MSWVRAAALFVAGAAGCVATPVPIPIPIESKELRLSAPTGGEVAVVGLAGATSGPAAVRVVNDATGEAFAGPVAVRGTFALIVPAWSGDTLRLHTERGGKASDEITAVVDDGLSERAQEVHASAPDAEGIVNVAGGMLPGRSAVVGVERTGEVVIGEAAGKAAESFVATVSAAIGDRIRVLLADGEGQASELSTVTVVAAGAAPPCIDDDGDGHGALNTELAACARPGSDCNDRARDVHPEQAAFFPISIFRAPAALDYDYDCDGREEPELATALDCATAQGCGGEAWLGAVPACGDEGSWARCVLEKTCVARAEGTRRQACR